MRLSSKIFSLACAGFVVSAAPAVAQSGDGRSWPTSAFVGDVSKEITRSKPTATRQGRRVPRDVAVGTLGGGSVGKASFYWQGQRVASGGLFNPNGMTAAHKTLPFGTRVRVTHLGNGRSVDVTINDRGPFIAGRIIDLSKGAAGVIGMHAQGVANVRMDILGR